MARCSPYAAAFLDELYARAEASPRRRMHHNLHCSHEEPVQRLFNAICTDSYIQPHRHSLDPKAELLMAARGRFAVILFDDGGHIVGALQLGNRPGGTVAVELGPLQWHTVIALEAGAVLFEVKQGPFDPTQPKEPASWCPQEGAPAAYAYLERLRVAAVQALG